MKTILGFKKVIKFKKPVVVLGVFDGVHLGHRKIIRFAVELAKKTAGTSILVTFWPHPQKEESLYSLEHRLNLIAELGIQAAIVVKFDRNFSQLSAEDFIRKVLVDKLKAEQVLVGENFYFGRGASGNIRLLNDFSRIYGFKLKVFRVVKVNHEAVSSTYIRKLIKNGEIRRAQKLLTRPVSVLGIVIHGTSLARKMGFATANIDPHHEVVPRAGVYAVKIIFQRKQFKGICYIGPKPTFIRNTFKGKLLKEKHIEVHIFDFSRDIYGKTLEIQFMKKIRKVQKFASLEELSAQVRRDALKAKRSLGAS